MAGGLSDRMKFRVLHITCVGRLSPGVRKQLHYEVEVEAASRQMESSMDTICFHGGNPVYDFERRLPLFFRSLFLRNLYLWYYMLKHQSEYDYILQRYITFDLFLLVFGWFVNNRITVHHTKEVAELKVYRLKWVGLLAAGIERITGWINARQVKAFVGVTRAISRSPSDFNGVKKEGLLYPNGISTELTYLLADRRTNQVSIAFVCTRFDLLIDSFNSVWRASCKLIIHSNDGRAYWRSLRVFWPY